PLGGSPLWSDGNWRSFAPAAAPRSIPRPAPVAATPLKVPSDAREKTIERARGLLGKMHIQIGNKSYADDCAGLVRGLFDSIGLDVLKESEPEDNAVTAIYRSAQNHG